MKALDFAFAIARRIDVAMGHAVARPIVRARRDQLDRFIETRDIVSAFDASVGRFAVSGDETAWLFLTEDGARSALHVAHQMQFAVLWLSPRGVMNATLMAGIFRIFLDHLCQEDVQWSRSTYDQKISELETELAKTRQLLAETKQAVEAAGAELRAARSSAQQTDATHPSMTFTPILKGNKKPGSEKPS